MDGHSLGGVQLAFVYSYMQKMEFKATMDFSWFFSVFFLSFFLLLVLLRERDFYSLDTHAWDGIVQKYESTNGWMDSWIDQLYRLIFYILMMVTLVDFCKM